MKCAIFILFQTAEIILMVIIKYEFIEEILPDSTGNYKNLSQRSTPMLINLSAHPIYTRNPFKETYEEEKKSIDSTNTRTVNIPESFIDYQSTYAEISHSALRRKRKTHRKINLSSIKTKETIILCDRSENSKIIKNGNKNKETCDNLNRKLTCCNNESCICALF